MELHLENYCGKIVTFFLLIYQRQNSVSYRVWILMRMYCPLIKLISIPLAGLFSIRTLVASTTSRTQRLQ